MIVGLHHVAVGVPDIDAGVRFYTEALGAELLWRSELDGTRHDADRVIGLQGVRAGVAMLRLGQAHVELWEYRDPAQIGAAAPPNALGYPHIAVTVVDIEAEHARLIDAGMTFVGPPVDLGASKAVYGRDPFGNLIELYEIDLG